MRLPGWLRLCAPKALHVESSGEMIDIVGTGGDRAGTIQISTTAAFVGGRSSLRVAKHGNRAASSRSGSADVLEALGVRIDLTPEQVKVCLEEVGMCFMFAQVFHPAMKMLPDQARDRHTHRGSMCWAFSPIPAGAQGKC